MARIAPTGRQSGDLKLHPVAPDVYLYRGFFSNSAVLVLPKSVMVVDTQITPKAGHRAWGLFSLASPAERTGGARPTIPNSDTYS